MTGQSLEQFRTVVRKKLDKRRAKEPPVRLELRVDSAWLARVQDQADRHGVSVSAYIRLRTNAGLEADEANDPHLEGNGK